MKLLFSLVKNQSGYMTYFLILGIVFLALIFIPKLYTTPLVNKATVNSPQFCRDMVDDSNAPIVKGPDYSTGGVNTAVSKDYKLIKGMVPVPYYFLVATPKQHFFNDYEERYQDPATGKKYLKKVPNGEGGSSYKLPGEDGQENYLVFADYGLLFLFHMNEDGTPFVLDEFEIEPGNMMTAMVADIYKATDKPDLPDWVLKCVDTPPGHQSTFKNNGIYRPNQNPSVNQDELQLEYFLLRNYTLMLQAWWTPHCKPAVYLYPQKPTMVNVKVKPNGFLTYVDPLYDSQKGWNVLANPDGTLINQSYDKDNQKMYDYLYFESKIRDQAITKLDKGWVIKYEELNAFYMKVLPELGFNNQQQSDFIEYWQKSLPESPYYFVSLVDPKEIDSYEELDITPKPDQVNRVRFYFEPRTEYTTIEPLDLSHYYQKVDQNADFTVFEWGGLLKRDKDHEFTCSM